MIRRCILLFAVAALFWAGCSKEAAPGKNPANAPQTGTIFRAGAALSPLGAILNAVGKPYVAVSIALPPNRSAHEYELSARETAALAGCRFYLSLGLPFERNLPKLLPGAKIVNPIEARTLPVLLPSPEEHDHGAMDPHVFLHPENNIALAKEIAAAFAELDPDHRAEYAQNAETFIAEQRRLQKEIAAMLAPFQGRKFYVQHPAFAYFGVAYGLTQIPLEEHASGASAKELAACIRNAKEEKIRGILIQRESSRTQAQVIARAIGGRLWEVDPLSGDLLASQKTIAEAVKESLQ